MAVFAVTVSQCDKVLHDLHASIEARRTRISSVIREGCTQLDTVEAIAQPVARHHSKSGGTFLRSPSGAHTGFAFQSLVRDLWATRTGCAVTCSPLPVVDDLQDGLPIRHRIETIGCSCAIGAAIHAGDLPPLMARCALEVVNQPDSLQTLLLKLRCRFSIGKAKQNNRLVNSMKHISVLKCYKRTSVFKSGFSLVLHLKLKLVVSEKLQALSMTYYAAKFFGTGLQSIVDLHSVLGNSVKRWVQAAINIVAFVQACDSDRDARVLTSQVAAAHFEKTARSGLLSPCKDKDVLYQPAFNLSARVSGVLV